MKRIAGLPFGARMVVAFMPAAAEKVVRIAPQSGLAVLGKYFQPIAIGKSIAGHADGPAYVDWNLGRK